MALSYSGSMGSVGTEAVSFLARYGKDVAKSAAGAGLHAIASKITGGGGKSAPAPVVKTTAKKGPNWPLIAGIGLAVVLGAKLLGGKRHATA